MLLNPNGRFEVSKKICLSMSNYHPELWQPAWGIRTIMEALRSFFPTPGEGAIGALDWPVDVRKRLAIESQEWTCEVCQKRNDDILPLVDESVLSSPAIAPVMPEVAVMSPRARPVAVEAKPVGESNRELLLNVSIFSIIFIIIALIVEIIIHP
jgi:hypothetical protein